MVPGLGSSRRRRAPRGSRGRRAPRRSPASSRSPSTTSTARSIVCLSWRMLPGQRLRLSQSRARSVSASGAPPVGARAERRRKWRASSGMSPRALAQRRQAQGDQVQAVEQVLAELPARHHLGEVAVGGRDHPHVDRARDARAQHLVGAVLEHPQQLHLRGGSSSPISSRKMVPPSRHLEAPLAVRPGVGEGAAHVAEHLALEEGRGDAAEVHLDERPVLAPAVAVDRLGHQLLAGAALAGDQHRGVGRRHAADQLEDLAGTAGRRRSGRAKSQRRSSSSRSSPAPSAALAAAARPARSRTACRSWALVHGLVMKSTAPAFIPSTARAIEPQAVIRITGSRGRSRADRAPAAPAPPRPWWRGRSSCPGAPGRTPARAAAARASSCDTAARVAIAVPLEQEPQRGDHRRVVVDDQNDRAHCAHVAHS